MSWITSISIRKLAVAATLVGGGIALSGCAPYGGAGYGYYGPSAAVYSGYGYGTGYYGGGGYSTYVPAYYAGGYRRPYRGGVYRGGVYRGGGYGYGGGRAAYPSQRSFNNGAIGRGNSGNGYGGFGGPIRGGNGAVAIGRGFRTDSSGFAK